MTGELVKAVGELPLSKALGEVPMDTLSELLSRDPEGFTEQDDKRVILALREHRARLDAAESTPGKKTKTAISAPSEAFNIKDLDL